jgi:two-component system, chemotaxis family, sensor kinase CheA
LKPLNPRLLAVFETEQREHLRQIRTHVESAGGGVVLSAGPALDETFRSAHTWKGAARAVGLGEIETLAHRLETLFARVREGSLALDAPVVAAVQRVLDAAEDVLAGVIENRTGPDVSPALAAIEAVLGIAPAAAPAAPQAARAPAPAAVSDRPMDFVRVNAKRVDDLVRSSSQLAGASAVQLRAAAESGLLWRRIREAEREWAHLRRRAGASLRRLRGGAEAARVAECMDFAGGQFRALASHARAASLVQQRSSWAVEQLGAQVYEEACRVRMIAAETVFDGFRKMVRDLAREAGKEVDFRTEGLDVQADRLVLQELKDPVMHLLRNAIAHGIETPRERAAAGKPAAGILSLRLEARGGRLQVTVEDDGKGVDFERVAEVAASKGLIPSTAASRPPAELARFIWQPGFSTARALTTLAGRGMGLPVVQDRVSRLQGEVTFQTDKNPGTAIVLSVPLSISTHHVILVGCANHTFALPVRAVERLCRVRREDIESLEGSAVIRVGSRPVPLAKLAALAGLPESGVAEEAKTTLVAVLRSGDQRVGVIVDALLDERETIVKDLGIPPASAGMSTGGVPLEDGTVAVVLSPAALLARFSQAGAAPAWKPPQPAAEERAPEILVVDDSITTRSLERSILEAHGYRVRIAVDGMEALAQLRAQPADLVIADIMMPRMDGFQLLEEIKKDKQLSHIPVIIVTSLERREEQERGLSLGADAYITKRKFDQRELLNTVRQIL